MHHISNSLATTDPWMIGLVIGTIIFVLLASFYLVHRRTVSSDGLTPEERDKYLLEESEILSMLRQKAGPLTEKEIMESLPYNFADLAKALRSLEIRELVQRDWIVEHSTFLVSTTS